MRMNAETERAEAPDRALGGRIEESSARGESKDMMAW